MKKVGVITWHNYHNYGGRLQTYALQELLTRSGQACKVINYLPKKENVLRTLLKIAISLIMNIFPFLSSNIVGARYWNYLRFQRRYIRTTARVNSIEELKCIISEFDSIICGSDQIWSPIFYNPIYMLCFVTEKKKKLSYAASIGTDYLPNELVREYKKWISRLDAVSVREKKGAELLKIHCDIDAEVVLDPVLLLDEAMWDDISKRPKLKTPYIFCYFLNSDHWYSSIVNEISKKRGLNTVCISSRKQDRKWASIFETSAGPAEFIGYIKHADMILTDSYHGMLFSIIYKKDFYVFRRFDNDDVMCQNSRIIDSLNKFDLFERMINNNQWRECREISYKNVDDVMIQERKKSLDFLFSNL